jgi:hypothetical protein
MWSGFMWVRMRSSNGAGNDRSGSSRGGGFLDWSLFRVRMEWEEQG